MTRKIFLVLLLAFLVSATATAQDKSYDAESFNVDVTTQADGSLLVEEDVTFRFRGGPFSYVFRELPTDHTDGIAGITAGADGVAWPQGKLPGQVEISGSDPIRITWHLSPTSDTTQTFNLTYRPQGVIRQADQADVLEWQALPDDYEYAVDGSQVTIHFPPGSELGEPIVLAGESQVTSREGQAVFSMRDLSPGDPLVVRLNFAPDTFSGSPPAWQAQSERQQDRAWIWITAAAVVLATGLMAIYLATRSGARHRTSSNSLAHKPPLDMSPALAGYLFSAKVSWQHGLATLLDLAGHGLLEIEEIGEKKWYRQHEFILTLLDRPGDLRPHERALVDILFIDKSGNVQDVIALSEMGHRLTSTRWKQYTESLTDEADGEGLLDHEAQRRSRRLIIWGVMLMLLSVPVLAMVFLLAQFFGGWPLILVGAIFIVGLICTIAGAAVSPLSARGVQLADAFEPFRRFLEGVAKGKQALPDPAYFEAYFPYATAFGFAQSWAKQQEKSGFAQAPSYFRALSQGGGAEMVAFLAAISAATNSGGAAAASAAGAAGAGAAGGGASGAG